MSDAAHSRPDQPADHDGWPREDDGWPREDGAPAGAPADRTDPPAGDRAGPADLEDWPLDEHGMPTADALYTALQAVMDPEIGIDVVNLGLVYDVEARDGHVQVLMTLTSMGCPLTELIHQQVVLVLNRLPGVETVDVEFTFSPPWSPEMISEQAREELQAMGFMV